MEDENYLSNYKTGGDDLNILFIGTKSADIPGVFVVLESFLRGELAGRGTFGGNIDELTFKLLPKLTKRTNSSQSERDRTVQNIPVQFMVVTGVDDMSYLTEEFLENILEGNVASGTKVDHQQPTQLPSSSVTNRAPHAVVYCIAATKTYAEVNIKQYERINRILRQRDIYQLGIVTNVSKLESTIQPDTVYSSQHVNSYLTKIAKTLCLDVQSVFPVFTYTDEREMNDMYSAIALDAFRHIVKAADRQMRTSPGRGKFNRVFKMFHLEENTNSTQMVILLTVSFAMVLIAMVFWFFL